MTVENEILLIMSPQFKPLKRLLMRCNIIITSNLSRELAIYRDNEKPFPPTLRSGVSTVSIIMKCCESFYYFAENNGHNSKTASSTCQLPYLYMN